MLSATHWQYLADQALAGNCLTNDQALAVLQAPDLELLNQLAAAYRVRHRYWGNRVRLHYLLNAQSGLCPEDCHYCSQSKISTADIDTYPLLAEEKILAAAAQAQAETSANIALTRQAEAIESQAAAEAASSIAPRPALWKVSGSVSSTQVERPASYW